MPAIIEKMCLLLFQDIYFVRKPTWGSGGGGWMLLDSAAQSRSHTYLKFEIKTLAHFAYWWNYHRDQIQVNAFSMRYCSRVWLTFGRVGVEIFPNILPGALQTCCTGRSLLPSAVQTIPPLYRVLSPDWIKWAGIPENVFSLSMHELGEAGETWLTNSEFL